MSITREEWDDYLDYLTELTDEEIEIELQWLESVGIAKQRGSLVTSDVSFTLQ